MHIRLCLRDPVYVRITRTHVSFVSYATVENEANMHVVATKRTQTYAKIYKIIADKIENLLAISLLRSIVQVLSTKKIKRYYGNSLQLNTRENQEDLTFS